MRLPTSHISHITIDGLSFALHAPNVSYRFHVDPDGDLVHDHFGPPTGKDDMRDPPEGGGGWRGPLSKRRREFPDHGRGDFRLPAVHIKHGAGHTVTQFVYVSHEAVEGKPPIEGLPATFGDAASVSNLRVHLKDKHSPLVATLSYSIFPEYSAIARSFVVENKGEADVVVERAMSWSVDMPEDDWEMVQLSGDWAREAGRVRRQVQWGTQGFQSSAGYSSHFHNPFLALVKPETTESSGDAYGFSLIYSGSHAVQIEKFAPGHTRVLLGLNPLQLSWSLGSGETFSTPECAAVYSDAGLSGMSRALHGLYRKHLIKSRWALETRPTLINNWEATYFDFDAESVYKIAKTAAGLGVKLFVLDDGWFGNVHPRTSASQGLGDWEPNRGRFPDGLGAFVDDVTKLTVNGSGGDKMRFGIWVEPEMVNPSSALFEAHPDWVLTAPDITPELKRKQLVLNLGLREVQEFIIDTMTHLLESADITYIKWDNNRAMYETPMPSSPHQYILGLYHILHALTSRFPTVLWENCASGGGRFDPGMLYYFPQTWTSDDSDALERLSIQFGTSLAYPASAMGCHISAVPNHQLGRVTPLEFRAHVALMGGSFGFELDLEALQEEERGMIPGLVKLSERVGPLVVGGEMYRLVLPEESNWPAVMYVGQDGQEAVLLAYQVRATMNRVVPSIKMQGLRVEGTYEVDGKTWSGETLMGVGLKMGWDGKGDYASRVLWVRFVD